MSRDARAPWDRAQAAMAALGIDALLLCGVAAQEAIGGHRRIAVFQSDPPGPAFALCRSGPPHVCTPDPEGALHLPADHVHAIAFDGGAFGRALPAWLGSAAEGVIAVDRAAPGAHAAVADACPRARIVDAAPVLARLTLDSTNATQRPAHDPDAVVATRRARVAAAAGTAGIATWWCTTPEAIRMITGARGPHAAAIVGDQVLGTASVDAALDQLPVRGRIAVDRLSLGEHDALLAARPQLEVVDAGPLLLAGAMPRSAGETALLREGYLRTELAVAAVVDALGSMLGTRRVTERDCADALAAAGTELGLEPHIDHVWTVLPRDRASVPWLRGEWAGRAPWRQLTSERAVEPGDLIALDAGFFFDGYVTDFGWTFTVGAEPSPAQQALARRWTEIAERVTHAIRPGATAADLRAAALDGWGGREPPWPFGLYVAHGVGFGGVVPPFAGTDLGPAVERAMVLHPGDVVMIEPYVYEDGVGGYRAERCAAVTDAASETWTTLPIERLRPLGR